MTKDPQPQPGEFLTERRTKQIINGLECVLVALELLSPKEMGFTNDEERDAFLATVPTEYRKQVAGLIQKINNEIERHESESSE